MAFETLWLNSSAGAVVYTAAEWRQIISTLVSAGVVDGLVVSQNSGVANMTVQMAAGRAVIQGVSTEGRYLAYQTSATTGIVIGAAPVTAGQSRNDIVCLKTNDPAAAGGSAGRNTVPVVVAGTPAATGTQTDPPIPAFHLPIARVTVAQGTAAITDAMITDIASRATLAFDVVDDDNASRLGDSAVTPGALVRRTSVTGQIIVPATPNDPLAATARTYVDGLAALTSGTLGDVHYSKLASGMVFVEGSNEATVTLPVGYRPAVEVTVAGVFVGGPNAPGWAPVQITTGGVIRSLDPLTYLNTGTLNASFSAAFRAA